MAVATCAGSSNGGAPNGFEWTGEYDDVAHTVTITSAGVGIDTAVVEQSNGQRARIDFAAAGEQRPPIVIPQAIQATVDITRTVTTGAPLTITGVTLKPNPPSKPGGVGGFVLVCDYWTR
jgi:hypothetical protein